MAGFVKGLAYTVNAVFTPKKQTLGVPSAHAATLAQMNAILDTDTRKRKPDLYDDIPGVEDGDDAAQTTPTTNKARKINPGMYAPGTVPHSVERIKRRSARLSSDGVKATDSYVDPEANLEHARMPDAARLQPDNPQPTQAEIQPETSTAPGEAKAEEVMQEENGDVTEVHALLDHKMLEDKSVDLLVHWQGESPESATWEPETEVQEGASELLFSYWEKAGGRDRVLFKIESEVYHVFRILNHEKKPQGSFMLEVQWVGYSATKGNTSWETEVKLKKIAPELLDAYWESIGGRNDFLSKRGRTKKNA